MVIRAQVEKMMFDVLALESSRVQAQDATLGARTSRRSTHLGSGVGNQRPISRQLWHTKALLSSVALSYDQIGVELSIYFGSPVSVLSSVPLGTGVSCMRVNVRDTRLPRQRAVSVILFNFIHDLRRVA
jgi:hypothetical protein